MTSPSDRLRALHKQCAPLCYEHAIVGDRVHCWQCEELWPCDTIKALDAADKLAEAVERVAEIVPRVRLNEYDAALAKLDKAARAYRGTEYDH